MTTKARAEELLDRINLSMDAFIEAVKDAYVERIWEPLGYDSWESLCANRIRVRFSRDDRKDVVVVLRNYGLSTRAIASAIGVSNSLVSRDSIERSASIQGEEFVGLDGKKYSNKGHSRGGANPRVATHRERAERALAAIRASMKQETDPAKLLEWKLFERAGMNVLLQYEKAGVR